MILYFTGTGNSAYVAGRIAAALGDSAHNLFRRIRDGDSSGFHSENPWVVVVPTYAWRIPRVVEDWLETADLSGSREMYFVMTCGANIGNAGKYLRALCGRQNRQYRGCLPVVMPENYIAVFRTPTKAEALSIIDNAEATIDAAVACIRAGRAFAEPAVTVVDQLSSGIVNDIFYPLLVHAGKFHTTDACVSCGLCENVCPLRNIALENGRPVWGKHCTHCMACICRCPQEAIEYGKHSKGLRRYTCPKQTEGQEG